MDGKFLEVSVREISDGFFDNEEEGCFAYGEKLNIRPAYQREFVYKDKDRNAVIDSISKGFPLNIIYWAKNSDGTYEVIDGQQRIISFCQYVDGNYSIDEKYFHSLEESEKEAILNYKLFVYVIECEDSKTKLDWFERINKQGEKLNKQELRNAAYRGPFVSHARKYFSKQSCPAFNLGSDYISGSPVRQDYLETVLDWINDGNIDGYMSEHQHDEDSYSLISYYEKVIKWVKRVLPTYRKTMKGVAWGTLYNTYGNNQYNASDLEHQVKALILNDEVQSKKGIFEYIFSGEEKHLDLRCFSEDEKAVVFEQQSGVCPQCGKTFRQHEMEADHIISWKDGGRTERSNCAMLCKKCNREKSSK